MVPDKQSQDEGQGQQDKLGELGELGEQQAPAGTREAAAREPSNRFLIIIF